MYGTCVQLIGSVFIMSLPFYLEVNIAGYVELCVHQ